MLLRRSPALLLLVVTSLVPLQLAVRNLAGPRVLPAGEVVALPAAGTQLVAPVDGRLRGVDFAAVVTGVAWPAKAGLNPRPYEAPAGRRLVVFALRIGEPTADVGPPDVVSGAYGVTGSSGESASSPSGASGNGIVNTIGATLVVGASSDPVPMGSIDDEVMSSNSGVGYGSAVFAASVPDDEHAVTLELAEHGYTQAFSLWSLRRLAPSPAVLYRSGGSPFVVDSTGSSAVGTIDAGPRGEFPIDFSLLDAVLGFFAPGDDAPNPDPSRAYLVIALNSDEAYTKIDQSIGRFSPLPAARLELQLPGGELLHAASVPASETAQSGTAGLTDQRSYYFDVPASMTSGTVVLRPGPVTGYFNDYDGPNVYDLVTTSRFPVTLAAGQTTPGVEGQPPWVGKPVPVPPLPLAAAPGPGGVGSGGSGFPVWLVVLLVVLAGAAVALELRRRRRGSAVGGHGPETPAPGGSSAPTEDAARELSAVGADGPSTPVAAAGGELPGGAGGPSAPEGMLSGGELLGGPDELAVKVLGPVEVTGWAATPERLRVSEELCCYLALHDRRPVSGEELSLALWPLDTEREVSRKTLHNYLSGLRRAVGEARLPDASGAGGYRLIGTVTDWHRFTGLVAAAAGADPEASRAMRARALSLVRGQPFAGAPAGRYGWALSESLASEMESRIARCAHELATELLEAGDRHGAATAARQGLLASGRDPQLWEDLARASDGPGRRRALTDAAAAIGDRAAGRIRDALGDGSSTAPAH